MSTSRSAARDAAKVKKGAVKGAMKSVKSAVKNTVKRRSPVEVLAEAGSGKNLKKEGQKRADKVNTLVRRGYFAGHEIVDANRNHLEPKELKDFFKAMPKTSFWYAYFFIQYFYGCRLSEPALILDEDIDEAEGLIIIKRLKKSAEEAGFREHVYKADPRVLACVKVAKAWKRVNKVEDNPFLFASHRRRPEEQIGAERLSQLRNLEGYQAVSRFTAHRMFTSLAESVSIPPHLCHSHVLRHTRATLMLAQGATPEQVQYLLGHSSLKMTMRYIGLAETLRAKLDSAVTSMGLGL